MKLYTIGFTQKRAETFFELLRRNGIQRLIDIRVLLSVLYCPQGTYRGHSTI